MKAKEAMPDTTTRALVEWLTFGNDVRPRAFPMAQAVCDEIWRAELWALDTAALARHYAQHKAAVDGLATAAGLSAPWVLAAIVEGRQREATA